MWLLRKAKDRTCRTAEGPGGLGEGNSIPFPLTLRVGKDLVQFQQVGGCHFRSQHVPPCVPPDAHIQFHRKKGFLLQCLKEV